MDNYKILYKGDEDQEIKVELLEQLGFQSIGMVDEGGREWLFTYDNSDFYQAIKDENFVEIKELTLPKLRDLVVLKRNDINDANCIDKKREAWYLASDGTYCAWQYRKLCWDTESDACVEAHDIKPITQLQAPALISGAEAYDLIGKRVEVEALCLQEDGTFKWEDAKYLPACDILNDGFDFRLKPTTITVNAELPKPSNVTLHNQNYSVTFEFKSREDRNAFEAALRGTNS